MTGRPVILFVDDEPRVLDGVRRSLRLRRRDWDVQCMPDGVSALRFMADTPCDVVVSDMRMPGMDGAQLLAHVSEQQPAAARVVLSGHFEQEAGLRASVVGHRFLSKPCDGEALSGLLEQLTRGTGPQDATVRSAAGVVHCLPIPAQQLERLTETLASPDVPLPEVVEAVRNSTGLVAKLLQLANSSFFCARKRGASLSYAVTALGLPAVQALLRVELAHWHVPGDAALERLRDLDAARRHSVAAARLVRALASPANASYAEAAALLQDTGRLALLSAGADARWRTSVPEDGDGAHADAVASHLLHLWGLPRAVVTAVEERYDVQEPEAHGLGIGAALRTAHLLLQETACRDPHDGSHPDELGELLRHPQLVAGDQDWRRLADLASQQTTAALR